METLFAKVSLLLTLTMLLGAFGAFCGRNVRSLPAWFGLALLFVFGTIAVVLVAKTNPMLGIGLLGGWAYVSGLVMGPALEHYRQSLGWKTVAGAFAGTAGVMSVCGAIGLFSGADFSSWGTYLGFMLFGLIILGVINIFVRFSKTTNILYSLAGMVVFAGYFIYDFFRLGRSENSWEAAVELTVSLYLDFLNFFFDLLRLLEAFN